METAPASVPGRIAIRRGEGERLRLGPARRPIEILIEPGTTGTRAFTMGVQALPPGAEVPLHRHAEEEILFVYAGAGRITVGGVTHAVEPETAVFVPGDTWHRIENPGPGELCYTFTLSPPGYEDFFRHLARTTTDHAPA
jgi:quercetin dioxygenase-like cupin family protein